MVLNVWSDRSDLEDVNSIPENLDVLRKPGKKVTVTKLERYEWIIIGDCEWDGEYGEEDGRVLVDSRHWALRIGRLSIEIAYYAWMSDTAATQSFTFLSTHIDDLSVYHNMATSFILLSTSHLMKSNGKIHFANYSDTFLAKQPWWIVTLRRPLPKKEIGLSKY